MTKLLTYCLVFLSFVAFSDELTSSNIVGYQIFDVGNVNTLMANPFKPVNSSETGKLGDIIANPIDDSDGTYDVWDWTGFVPFLDFVQTVDRHGNFTGKYTYVPENYDGSNKAGWYDFNDENCRFPMNDVEIPSICGFLTYCGDGNCGISPKLMFYGEVRMEQTAVNAGSSSLVLGNPLPYDITLGDIIPNSYNDEDGTYDVWDWTGFVPFLDFVQTMDLNGKFVGKYTYVPYGMYEGVGGWYSFDDVDCQTSMNNLPIYAGQAIFVNAGDGNGGISPALSFPGHSK